MITIAYMTNRKNPRAEWFFNSLFNQWQEKRPPIKLLVVDFYAAEGPRREQIARAAGQFVAANVPFKHVTPMPCIWQGPHRLTSVEFFAAANARNTAICHAEDGYLVFVDDVSVLLPGWLEQVLYAAQQGWVACGAYTKVLDLRVENGVVTHFTGMKGLDPTKEMSVQIVEQTAHKGGIDSRLIQSHSPRSDTPAACGGEWCFGCSLGAPVKALLDVRGFDGWCDGMGSEDYILGLMLQVHGYQLRYCRKMMTLESEEAHGEDKPFLRVIRGVPGRNDASWKLLNDVRSGRRRKAENSYDIAAVRDTILAGGSFPIPTGPKEHWFDGTQLVTITGA